MAEEERDREWDGKFAPDTSAQPNAKVAKKRRGVPKGTPKPPGSGRKKGTPNKATRAWKEFCQYLVDSGDFQKALEERVLARPEIGLRVAEFAVGRPTEHVDINLTGNVEHWLHEAREAARKRGKS